MSTKERIHRLIDVLSPAELETAARILEGLAALAIPDPVSRALALAPDDDEPVTDEERAAVAEAWADYHAGRMYSMEEVRRELGTERASSPSCTVTYRDALASPTP